MSILSAQTIKRLQLIKPLKEAARDPLGNSYGLGPCGYDLTLDQELIIYPGWFKLASAAEFFVLPNNVCAIMHDKSSLARQGLAVQNTVAEPGWHGYLTLEVTNHGVNKIRLPKGAAICQAVFHFLDEPTALPYKGKYQAQERGPQEAR